MWKWGLDGWITEWANVWGTTSTENKNRNRNRNMRFDKATINMPAAIFAAFRTNLLQITFLNWSRAVLSNRWSLRLTLKWHVYINILKKERGAPQWNTTQITNEHQQDNKLSKKETISAQHEIIQEFLVYSESYVMGKLNCISPIIWKLWKICMSMWRKEQFRCLKLFSQLPDDNASKKINFFLSLHYIRKRELHTMRKEESVVASKHKRATPPCYRNYLWPSYWLPQKRASQKISLSSPFWCNFLITTFSDVQNWNYFIKNLWGSENRQHRLQVQARFWAWNL